MLPTKADGPGLGNAEAIDVSDPEPGTFWRSRADIPDAGRTVHEQDRSGRLSAHAVHARDALPAGTLLLLRTVHRVDGAAHTLVTSGDPNQAGDDRRSWLVGEFLSAFEPVPEFEAQAVRASQVAASSARIAEMQAEMLAIASEAAAPAPIPAIAPPEAPRTPGMLTVARERAQSLALVAQGRSTRIAAVNVRLAAEMKLMMGLQSERTDAALATVQDALEMAESARKASESLDLFGGEAVEVIMVRDGAGAPPGTPVRLYQNRLYLDEELAVQLHQDGFDSRDLKALPEIVAQHPGVVDRMIPDARGVALVRIRREGKMHFGRDADISMMFHEMELMKLDREQFLLVRDGERLHLVFTETALQDAERLFPTRDELDRPFRGAGGADTIGFDDTRFVKALSEFERQALVYKRLLILLWGLEFGPVRPVGHVEPDGRPGDWHSPAWQERNLSFVPDDETRTLPDARPHIHQYLSGNAELLQAGSRVVVDWGRVLTPETAPSCVRLRDEYGERFTVTHKPAADFSVHTVRAHEGALVVDVPVTKLESYEKGRAAFRARVALSEYAGDALGFLVLDGLDDEDLSHYAESRISRRHYLDYLGLFRAARDALKGEFAAVRAIDARIAASLAEHAIGHEPSAVLRAVRTAHRLWRAEHSAKLPTARHDREIRDAAFLVLTGTPTASACSDIAGIPPGDVVMAGTTGRGRLVVMTPGPDDAFARSGAWLRRLEFAPAADGSWKAPTETLTTLPRPVDPSINATVTSPAIGRHVRASMLPVGITSPADGRAIAERLLRATPAHVAATHMGPVNPEAAVRSWYEEARRLTYYERPKDSERRGVLEGYLHTVVGAVVSLVSGSGSRRRPDISYLTVTSDPLARALAQDPTLSERLAKEVPTGVGGKVRHTGLLAVLWAHGGGHRRDLARRRADAINGGEPSFRLAAIGGADIRDRVMASDGPDHALSYDGPIQRRDGVFMPDGTPGRSDWIPLASAFGIPRYAEGVRKGDVPDARLVIRADTWETLRTAMGWVGEVPCNVEVVEP